MCRLALGLVLIAAAGCGASNRAASSSRTPAPPRGCSALVASLARLPEPSSMRVQRRELERLAALGAELRRRFALDASRAVFELGASVRAEHESVSARRDGRVTASRALHARASARYARGRAETRSLAASCAP